jgi:hypothetical protein
MVHKMHPTAAQFHSWHLLCGGGAGKIAAFSSFLGSFLGSFVMDSIIEQQPE